MMTTMDFWYDRAILESRDVNEEARELLRDAEEVLGPASPEHAGEDDE
jgi:hypothetical protein